MKKWNCRDVERWMEFFLRRDDYPEVFQALSQHKIDGEALHSMAETKTASDFQAAESLGVRPHVYQKIWYHADVVRKVFATMENKMRFIQNEKVED